jgi:tRNA(Leu) C34 or U34 (ribose-2'-O)-methylase TrmL
LEWLRTKGAAASDPAAWRACGRDGIEQAAALHRMAVVLARQKRYDEARRAVAQALELMPHSPILRRIDVALSEGSPAAVDAARQACPSDPDIWLAALVTQARAGGPAGWADAAIREATENDAYSVETLVRAGNFFLRRGMLAPAAMAARYAQSRAQGLVPAYVLALQCALATNDLSWAMSAAQQGVEHALDPSPFYKTIVDVKTYVKSTDADMIGALEYLKEHDYWVIGCDSSTGDDATTFEFPRRRVIVMGNEAEGMRRLVRENCDYTVRIPMMANVESLNISVASAVVMYLAMADLVRAQYAENGEEG